MRFIHTADWHLGRFLHGVRLTEDQAFLLDQFVELARDAGPDLIVIAGDVYDRAVPPPDAVRLLDDVLSRIVSGLGLPAIVIAGNHDSPERLGFGRSLFASSGLHIIGDVRAEQYTVTIHDKHGPVDFHPLPFFEPPTVRLTLDDDSVRDCDRASLALVDRIRNRRPDNRRSVLITHAFVDGGHETESERPLSIGGSDRVRAESFAGFDYVALGHLHQRQNVGSERIRYSGSLFKYSFSEADHEKSVDVVEMDSRGVCSVESVSLRPRRDLRRVSGYMADLLSDPGPEHLREAYVAVSLLDRGQILDARGRLAAVYPNILHVDRPALRKDPEDADTIRDIRSLSDGALFEAFFSQMTGEPLSADQRSAYESVVDDVRRAERETSQ